MRMCRDRGEKRVREKDREILEMRNTEKDTQI